MTSPAVITAYGQAQLDEVLEGDSRVTYLQRIVDLAVERTLRGVFAPPAHPSRTGFTYLTEYGENYPVRWAEAIYHLKPLRAAEFGNIVHNNAPGYVAIKRGIGGPQLVLTHGDVLTVAETILLAGDCDLMLCCVADTETGARVLALQNGSQEVVLFHRALTISAPSLDRFNYEWSKVTDG